MKTKEMEAITDMAVLDVKKGDTVVVRVAYPIANEVALDLESKVAAKVPDGVKVLVLDVNAEIGIVRAKK